MILPPFKPSVFQKAFFDFVEYETGSAVLEAVAGSGKTTTIIEALKLFREGTTVLLLAFNKTIADELAARVQAAGVKASVEVKTFNGLGHSILYKRLGRLTLDNRKMRGVIKGLMDTFDYQEFGQVVFELVGYARRFGLVPEGIRSAPLMPDTAESWHWLINHFGVEVEKDQVQDVIDMARRAIRAGVEMAAEQRVIDFDDQVYLPAIKKMARDTWDVILVDEAQDVSPVRTRLIEMCLRPGGRMFAVGDSFQAIYGFTGSDSEAMNTLRTKFDAVSLPLSISYRCAKKVVAAAQQVMPAIQAAETAPEGIVEYLPAWVGEDFQPGDMVLCRKNAPIVSLAWKLIGKGVACRILGRDIAGGIVKLINDLQPRGLNGQHGLAGKLEAWRLAEVGKWKKEERDDMVEAVNDKASCVEAIMARSTVRTVPDLIRSIEAMFTDDSSGDKAVTLCSMHKSKGLEADRVFILDRDLLPLKSAKQAWQIKQENNLLYVALTRAKKELYFIETTGMVEKKKAA